MFPPDLLKAAQTILDSALARGWKITMAESCTGGLIAALFTELPGASTIMDFGFVTYANTAKQQMIGVPQSLLETHGAVSEEVARAMAEGALERAGADLSIAVTGIAGPTGGTATKPVGLIHIASSRKGMSTLHMKHIFSGDRSAIRQQSVKAALELLQQQFAR